jgi:hypothetical protein
MLKLSAGRNTNSMFWKLSSTGYSEVVYEQQTFLIPQSQLPVLKPQFTFKQTEVIHDLLWALYQIGSHFYILQTLRTS